jgi:monomeric sarcosine oxidase
MKPEPYDVAVVGLGAAGAGALYALAKRGVRAIGVDRFAPPHDQGSSHGETRMLRAAYGEGAAYTPLTLRAVEMWRALEQDSGRSLFQPCGLIYAGPRSSPFLAQTRASAGAHGVEIVDLEGDARAQAGFVIPDAWQMLLEPEAGFLYAEPAIEALLACAVRRGAEVRTGAAVRSIASDDDGVRIAIAGGEIRAKAGVVAAGGWTAALIPALAPVLSVERRTIHWFADTDGRYAPARGFRPFYVEDEQGLAVYGLPDVGGAGVKIGEHIDGGEPQASPDAVDRAVHVGDEARTRALAGRYFGALGPATRAAVCLYPMSRDQDFILDRAPGLAKVVVLAGLSGHGFKFSPVLGDAAAAMALGKPPDPAFAPFRLDRFPEFAA